MLDHDFSSVAKAKGEYTDDLLEMEPENWSPYE